MQQETWDNAALYHACAAQGSDAQVSAYEVLWGYLHTTAFRMLREYPDADAFAADCAQIGLIKIHQNLATCKEPAAFRGWAASIVRRVVLDEMRRPDHARRVAMPDDEEHHDWLARVPAPPEPIDLRGLLLTALEHGPLSDRSRRVIVGKYLEDVSDEALARVESDLANQSVLPSSRAGHACEEPRIITT